jgi:hypothetical protein
MKDGCLSMSLSRDSVHLDEIASGSGKYLPVVILFGTLARLALGT